MNQRKSNIFKTTPGPKVNRNLFDLSHEVKMSGKFGYLYPILCIDTLPGDTFRDTMNCMIRLAPMLAPVMHRLDVTTHFFFVPNRILTDHWEDFITGGQDGLDASVLPFVTPLGIVTALGSSDKMTQGELWDYMGLPVAPSVAPAGGWSTENISVLPFRAIGKIWSDYYRDPNLDTEVDLDTEVTGNVSGLASTAICLDKYYFKRAFEKDYFTSALPWAQRGAQVLMPFSADVTYMDQSVVKRSDTGDPMTNFDLLLGTQSVPTHGGTMGISNDLGATEQLAGRIENIEDISNGSTTINDFRRAIAIQKWLEANARGGARYVEQIQGHFDVTVPDYRLQRAEYLGGGKQPIQISEVVATADLGGSLGDLAGHGISVGRTNTFNYRCQEHGFIIGILSVTMRTAYSQGIPKMWLKKDKFEFAWPELANLGEQEIKSEEIFFSYDEADEADNRELFGYTPRYSEYKFHNDRIAGDFRSTLGFWHLGRKFTTRPMLDSTFTTIWEDGAGVEETFRRIFAVTTDVDYLWIQLYHHLTAKRPLPYFGVPQII